MPSSRRFGSSRPRMMACSGTPWFIAKLVNVWSRCSVEWPNAIVTMAERERLMNPFNDLTIQRFNACLKHRLHTRRERRADAVAWPPVVLGLILEVEIILPEARGELAHLRRLLRI